MFLPEAKMGERGNIRTLGILVYVLGLLFHCRWGSSANLYWWGSYLLVQNVGMSMVCLGNVFDKNIVRRLVATSGLMYFLSASVFYSIMMINGDQQFFSQSDVAGCVLTLLILISTILTLLHYVFAPRNRKCMDVHS